MIFMNVLLASDDTYAPLLGVTIYSFLENNSNEFDEINIYVLDGGICAINRKKIQDICDEFDVNLLEFIRYDNIDEVLGIDIKATRPLSTFARLFATSLLDDSIDKILYLDCDAIITGSFKELYDMDIDDYYCAGVTDMGPHFNNIFLGLPPDGEHFNAGVLLVNLRKWREDNLEKKFLDYILANDGEVHHNDQGVINVVCRGKILEVHPKYNILSPFFEVSYEGVLQWNGLDKFYTKEIVQEAIDSPVFIHLTQFVNGRPWFTNAENHPLRELFDSYVQKVPFSDEEIYIEDTRHWKGKLLSFTYKHLPYSTLCNLFRIYRNYLIRKNT